MKNRELIEGQLGPSDDIALWQAVWDEIVPPIEKAAAELDKKVALYLKIGACSHWLRPHQTRLTAAGGFAWPSGYLGGRYSRLGLPELDWELVLRWDGTETRWEQVTRFQGKRRLLCRVAIPSRTARHQQAVVHVRWEPGTIEKPEEKATRYSAFRREHGDWRCVATGELWEHERHNSAVQRSARVGVRRDPKTTSRAR